VISLRLALLALLAVFAALAGALSPPAFACGAGTYTYAGVGGQSTAYGVGALVTPAATGSFIAVGHIAGWVGLGGPGEGPNGSNEWIQVGLSSFPLLTGNDVYYEVARPGTAPSYHQVIANVPSGTGLRVAVLEMYARPGWWRVWVDGNPVSPALFLTGSHGRWNPIATAESWDGGTSACNDFMYRFSHIHVARGPGGDWAPLRHVQQIHNTNTRVVFRAPDDFLAAGGTAGLRTLAAARG
jgi:hypothetical protein